MGVVYGIILVSTVWELRTDHTLQLFGRVISNASVEYAVGTDKCSKSLVFLEVWTCCWKKNRTNGLGPFLFAQ